MVFFSPLLLHGYSLFCLFISLLIEELSMVQGFHDDAFRKVMMPKMPPSPAHNWARFSPIET